MAPSQAGDRELVQALRLAAVSLGSALALAVALVLVWQRSGGAGDDPGGAGAAANALRDEDVRRAAIQELVDRGGGVWDSHVDPEVARVIQPGLDGRELFDVPIRSNRFGMREREYAEKPEGTTRVVLLGDSFILGHGITVEDRLGTFLEQSLVERGRGPVEVLSFGISSWNILAECAYVRRQLSFLRPDMVVQLAFNNDLDDTRGARGFGVRSRFAPAHRDRADGFVARDAPWLNAGIKSANLLLHGLDWESRERYRAAAAAMGDLARAVEEQGGEYLCLALWLLFVPMVEQQLTVELRPEQVVYVSDAFMVQKEMWAGPDNYHWGAAGNERVAKLLYGVIRERGLLSGLELSDWPEATAEIAAIDAVGRREAADPDVMPSRIAMHKIASRIDFRALTITSAGQVYGGVDGEGFTAPYASMTLRRGEARTLAVRGNRLGAPELRDVAAQVFVEEFPVGEIALRGDGPFEARFDLPADTLDRDYLTVRFESPDWVYRGESLDHCVSLQLAEVAVE